MLINVRLMIITSCHDDDFIKRCLVESSKTLPEFCRNCEKAVNWKKIKSIAMVHFSQ